VGVIFDTSELIFAERAGGNVRDALAIVREQERPFLSVISLAEFKHGVRRADTTQRAAKRQRFLDDVIASFVVLPITANIALRAGELDAELKIRGDMLEMADVFIAATALEYDFPIATQNRRHFERIDGLRIYTRE